MIGEAATDPDFSSLAMLGGIAAVAGGLLRVLAALPSLAGLHNVQWLYLAIDWLLLLALFALYVRNAARLRRAGLAALCVAVAAICLIRSQASFGSWAYPLGATALTGSVLALAFCLRRRRRFAAALWIWSASTAIGSIVIFRPDLGGVAFGIAGAIFGAGFVVVGLELASFGGRSAPVGP